MAALARDFARSKSRREKKCSLTRFLPNELNPREPTEAL